MRRIALCVLFFSVVPQTAAAQATLINGLGGTAGYGTTCLGMNDDGSSNSINITPYFPTGLRFFDTTHTSLYVNTNGNITFSGPLPTFTPDAFPVADRPMIAPYWADVDTREERCMGGFIPICDECGFGPGNGEAVIGPPCDNPPDNGVWWNFRAAAPGVPARAIFTWDRVGYYHCAVDHRMSFQLVLTQAVDGCGGAAGTDFDVEFRFNLCQWETGDASGGSGGFGGTEAQSGFDAGNSMDFVEIMGSRDAGIANILCTMSNVGEPGIWRFLVREGTVMCPDAGDACTIPGAMGVCATGRTNCVGSGTECVQDVMPSAERCDALDNDCNGMVDDGDDSLCPTGQVCEMGVCLAACFELGCPEGQVCLPSGNCIDAGCEDVTCPEGERCEGGTCVGACDGVTCPAGLMCRGGSCVDLCAGLTCDECTVCDEGVCVTRCPAMPCGAGETCLPDGSCEETACVGITCPSGSYCMGGSCVDACTGAVCPDGMECMDGMCINMREVDAGPPPPLPDAGMVLPLFDGGSIDMDDAGFDAGSRRPGSTSPGCGCRTVDDRGGSSVWLALAAIAIAWYRRRRGR